MKLIDITESKSTPCIVVDVQPAYGEYIPFERNLAEFLNSQRGPILMFVNAEDTGITDDTFWEIREWWEQYGFDEDNWDRTEIVDKGYGHFRAWMDYSVDDDVIIKVIRLMYQNKVTDSRELFGGEDDDDYVINMEALGVPEEVLADPLSVKWTSVGQLKKFSGAYIMGGGRNECLREVELLMNAFNITYKRVEEFVYG